MDKITQLYADYERALKGLRFVASKRDFTPVGDAEFNAEVLHVKAIRNEIHRAESEVQNAD